MLQARFFTSFMAVMAAFLVLFLTLPIVAMVGRETPQSLLETFGDPEVRAAIWVSISGAGIAAGLSALFGVPLGYLLSRTNFRGKELIQGAIDMPVVVPHTAVGIALLTVLGPDSLIGGAAIVGLRFFDALPGTVAAMLFVSAPFTINAARAAFDAVNVRLEKVSRGLGASATQTFFRVSLPLAIGPIIAGAIMCWARAMSEFGAVLVIAYYPRIGPTLMYDYFTSYGLKAARPVAVLLVLISLAVFIALRVASNYGNRRHA